MLSRIQFDGFEPFKSKVDLSLGKINVFIGANGSGKSRLLEAIGVFTGAICARDNGFVCQEKRGIRPGGMEDHHTEAIFDWVDAGRKAQHKVYMDGLIAFGRQDWHHTRRGTNADQLAIASWVDGYQIFDLHDEELRNAAPNSQAVHMGKHGQGFAALMRDTIHSHHEPFGVDVLSSLLPGIYGLHVEQEGGGLSLAASVRDREGKTEIMPATQMGSGILLAAGLWTLAVGRLNSEFLAIDNFAHSLHPALAVEFTRRMCQAVLLENSRRQLLIATNQPGVLAGLDLKDDAVRLFIVDEHPAGGKRVNRVFSLAEMQMPVETKLPTRVADGGTDVEAFSAFRPQDMDTGCDEEWMVGGKASA